MSGITTAAIVFAIVFIAEVPDNSGLASLILGTRYRPSWVFLGVAAAFALHVVLAVAAGGLLGLLPHRAVQIAVAAVFLIGAILLLRADDDDDLAAQESRSGSGAGSPPWWRPASPWSRSPSSAT